ncbi:MAG: NUMOD3 domain-containing DNA-binding protein [Candidatus Doudnabacteria bacterium]
MIVLSGKNLMPKTGVYLIFCIENKRVYVGSSATVRGIAHRFLHHRSALRKNNHRNSHLQNSWNKYGESAFLFAPIEYVSPEFCIEREQFWIIRLRPSFNIAQVACSNLGIKRTEEFKLKCSIAKKGKKHTPEHIAKIVAARKGFKYSEASKLRLSLSHIGAKNPNSKPVLCVELDRTFESLHLAAKFLRETMNTKISGSAIAACAHKGNRHISTYGLTWRYL